jgi:hypothetical protein
MRQCLGPTSPRVRVADHDQVFDPELAADGLDHLGERHGVGGVAEEDVAGRSKKPLGYRVAARFLCLFLEG